MFSLLSSLKNYGILGCTLENEVVENSCCGSVAVLLSIIFKRTTGSFVESTETYGTGRCIFVCFSSSFHFVFVFVFRFVMSFTDTDTAKTINIIN